MTTSKQAKLSITLKSVELIKELSLGLAPIGCIAARNFCNEISRTLINQAGEISALEQQLQEKSFLLKRAEEFRDSWGNLACQLLEMDMEDLDFQVIDGVDIERITHKAQAAILAFDAKVTAANKMAASFQQARQNESPVNIRLDLTIGIEAAPHLFESEVVFFGFDPAGENHNAN